MIPRDTIAWAGAALWCCLSGVDAQYNNCTNATVADIGNGQCDAELNVPSCGFDGGDCCPCTCVDGPTHSCSDNDFDCLYPHCVDDGEATSEETTCNEDWKSDGYCDSVNNGPECEYDGGDCCDCTCVDGAYSCGINGFSCEDPACFDPGLVAEFPDCTGNWLSIGDGTCNAEENNLLCGFDGGDCCLCTCNGAACSIYTFDCLDSAAGDEFFQCSEPPPAVPPCPAGAQPPWVVDSSVQAQALAAAVNCSGGSFEVEWRGSVVVNEPIYVGDGTVVAVTGADTGAVIDGNAATRLFTVVNAALSLSGVNVSNGASTVGGAIAASGSTLSFNRTNFVGNRATQHGGGVYVSDVSDVSCFEVSFIDNGAEVHGGGMLVAGRSVVSCGASWVANAAGHYGGALSVEGESTVFWDDGAVFVSNTAGRYGGALDASNGSRVSWSASTWFESNAAESGGGAVVVVASSLSWTGSTVFASNSAVAFHGGALHVEAGSIVSWDGDTAYVNNIAVAEDGGGGALFVNGSLVAWTGATSYVGNEAGYGGGALYLESSNVSWGGEFTTTTTTTTTVFDRNRSGRFGGGVFADLNSHISCDDDAASTFSGNSAREYGGAILLNSGSSVSFSGNSSFDGNSATGDPGAGGGAIYVRSSNATWKGLMSFTGNEANSSGGAICAVFAVVGCTGETKFLDNKAHGSGGAVYLARARLSWEGEMEFFNNTAVVAGGGIEASSSEVSWSGKTHVKDNHVGGQGGGGGGFVLHNGSIFSWSGDTEFTGNMARLGGALLLVNRSRASWSAISTTFHNNSGILGGGGLVISGSSEVSWSGDTEYTGNRALSGGAVLVYEGSSVGWTGATTFSSNAAGADGGAVGSPESGLLQSSDSTLTINGSTSFSNNTAGANGGAVALLGGLSLEVGSAVDVVFSGNHADVAGGAVFVSGTGVGPTFSNLSFVSNSAQAGGAVSMMASGNLKDITDIVPPSPTIFDRCRFIDNTATATGGAVESASGHDAFVGSVFQGNMAGTSGGALRLAGTASVDNCSFEENVSNDGGGAALSNIGVISKMENASFRGNVFACPPGMFLGFNATGDPYEVACDGCQKACDGCSFEEPPLVPMCRDAMEHAFSDGGTGTLEMLSIERGYWRAIPSSEDVLACYNSDACLGGTTGTSDYCLEGYEGPYCSICARGYTGGLSFTCSKCFSGAGVVVLASFLAVVALVVAVAVLAYAMSGKARAGRRGMVERLGRYIPLQSVKIVIVAWQILTQFTSVANITYPLVYQRFLNGLDVFNFDLSWVLSAGCVLDIDFHDRLLASTIGPIVALSFLGGTYAVAAGIHRGDAETMQTVWNKHVSMVLLLTFLVYSSVSSILFKTFACEDLEDGKNYVRADYRIECDSAKHKAFQVYAGLMMLLYTVGIPVFYGVVLFRDRDVLKRDQVDREETARTRSISDLWKPYRPSVFYYEVIECGRRVLLASVVVFIYPNTAAQIAATLVIAFLFVVVSEALAPYASRWDTWLNRMGHAVVYMSMFVALLLKVDVSDERADSQQVFEVVLVTAHACMVLVVVVETVVLMCALRVEQRKDPSPRFRLGKALFRGKGVVSARTSPFSGDIYGAGSPPVGGSGTLSW